MITTSAGVIPASSYEGSLQARFQPRDHVSTHAVTYQDRIGRGNSSLSSALRIVNGFRSRQSRADDRLLLDQRRNRTAGRIESRLRVTRDNAGPSFSRSYHTAGMRQASHSMGCRG